jgi:hypothetical protein
MTDRAKGRLAGKVVLNRGRRAWRHRRRRLAAVRQ